MGMSHIAQDTLTKKKRKKKKEDNHRSTQVANTQMLELQNKIT